MKHVKTIVMTTASVAIFSVFSAGAASPERQAAPVQVTNLPLWTVNFNEPAYQPFHRVAALNFPPNAVSASAFFGLVPTDKRLVVEFVSASARLPAGQQLTHGQIASMRGIQVERGHFMQWSTQATSDSLGLARFVLSQPMRMYAESETDLWMFAERTAASGSGSATVYVSGYLVDAPRPQEIIP